MTITQPDHFAINQRASQHPMFSRQAFTQKKRLDRELPPVRPAGYPAMNPQLRSGRVLMLVLGAAGCRGPAVERDAFTVEAERVRSITTTGGRVNAVDKVVREPLRVSQAWRLALQTDWATFAAESARSLAATYRCTPEADGLACVRSIPGDQFSLSYTRAHEGRVQARLEARPD